ncbi:MAG: peptidase S9 [Calditrichaeota bacterium]|nr:MAG: peptidase S9 [Calditrichota bacterium]
MIWHNARKYTGSWEDGVGTWTGFRLWIVGAALLLGLAFTVPLSAQYFGRNKVQYEDFDFRVLETQHFQIYFYTAESLAVKDPALMLERWYSRLQSALDHELSRKNPLVLYANHADFQQNNIIGGLISEGTGGVTEGLQNRIVLPLTGLYADNDHVLGHELVHAFQYDIARTKGKGIGAMARLPLWFVEGMAEYFSVGREDANTAMWLRDAVLHKDMPTLEKLSYDPRYFPYRFGQAVWAYVGGRWGDDRIVRLFKAAVQTDPDSAFVTVMGISPDSLSAMWIREVTRHYEKQLEGRTLPREVGRRLLAPDVGAGEMNVSPELSPDGRYVAFLSEKSLFTIDLYLADAHTGKVLAKLASSESDRHFDAIRFIRSAGSWSPDGKQFAFVVYRRGNNAIIIVDVNTRKITRRVEIPGVDAIEDVAWSPDGQYLAVAGTHGGISDLFLYHLNDGKVRRLTDDRYGELQPAWSPDGKRLAFVTDRGPQTDLEKLTYGPMQIALLDVSTGKIERLPLFPLGKHINPQFSPDGKSLYFVANPDGFSDLYRYDFEEGRIYRLTRVATGISGITALSPCLTVARQTGEMIVTVFEKRRYIGYALSPEQLTGEPVEPAMLTRSNAALLPPEPPTAEKQLVMHYLRPAASPVPPDTAFQVNPYKPSFKLAYAGQGYIGVSADRFGTALGGGVNLLFADVLNNHLISVGLQLNGSFKDAGGQLIYLNRKKRFNWGAALSRIPYRVEQAFVGIEEVRLPDGSLAFAQVTTFIRQRVFNDRLLAMGEYPLSTNRRVEGAVGFNRISFDNEIETITTFAGQTLAREVHSLPAPEAINLFQASIGYVGDYSYFGFTSPIKGSRYRFDIEGSLGTLDFATVIADYRQYFFFNPFTLAFRGLHFGRYFKDAENERLTPLFLGYETLVRGYSIGSFEGKDCSSTDDPQACPEYDRLIGSRIAVFNAELRVPLLGTERFGLVNFPVLPTELALFFDAGAAWTSKEGVKLKFVRESVERVPVFSAGVALRFNVFGFLIPQVYYAIPFQRPARKNGLWGFVLAVGW